MGEGNVDVQRKVGYGAGILVVFEDASDSRRKVATIPNKGYTQQARQDAHEIAAIPQMLRALHACERLLDSVAFVSTEGDTEEPLALIRESLAKATGGAL
ncbi:hypothetical protein [Luteibacter sp. SG786]|uniref:hypothetical protein n=1 Tax=Luteibacter sp. SG786 TaxID=2587130 RepID=UPI00141FCF5B|nr:hypothetical protein [Luteibacter sp. SG786]NII54367.1 hypothetical protein [Luteibacter sp. SG786]